MTKLIEVTLTVTLTSPCVDTDNSNTIDFTNLHPDPNPHLTLTQGVDPDNSNTIDFEEFCLLMLRKQRQVALRLQPGSVLAGWLDTSAWLV